MAQIIESVTNDSYAPAFHHLSVELDDTVVRQTITPALGGGQFTHSSFTTGERVVGSGGVSPRMPVSVLNNGHFDEKGWYTKR